MNWKTLTLDEIDALDGIALSWAVCEAMGREVWYWMDTREAACDIDDRTTHWHPHCDANQALEALAAICGPEADTSIHRVDINTSGRTALVCAPYACGMNDCFTSGTFAAAITRMALKLMVLRYREKNDEKVDSRAD